MQRSRVQRYTNNKYEEYIGKDSRQIWGIINARKQKKGKCVGDKDHFEDKKRREHCSVRLHFGWCVCGKINSSRWNQTPGPWLVESHKGVLNM
jgi:hypothetical protein